MRKYPPVSVAWLTTKPLACWLGKGCGGWLWPSCALQDLHLMSLGSWQAVPCVAVDGSLVAQIKNDCQQLVACL